MAHTPPSPATGALKWPSRKEKSTCRPLSEPIPALVFCVGRPPRALLRSLYRTPNSSPQRQAGAVQLAAAAIFAQAPPPTTTHHCTYRAGAVLLLLLLLLLLYCNLPLKHAHTTPKPHLNKPATPFIRLVAALPPPLSHFLRLPPPPDASPATGSLRQPGFCRYNGPVAFLFLLASCLCSSPSPLPFLTTKTRPSCGFFCLLSIFIPRLAASFIF